MNSCLSFNRVLVILRSTVFLHVEHAAILLDDAAVLQPVRRLLPTPASAATEVSGTKEDPPVLSPIPLLEPQTRNSASAMELRRLLLVSISK